ncbi:MAG: restriction endonuclease subunit S [Tissierella sp.]
MPLGELCKLKAGKFIKAAQISDYNKGNMYPCYGGNGLRGYVEEYTHNGSYPLIGRQGALCGNVQFAEDKFYATEHAIVTRPTLEIDVIWLYIMLREMNLNRLATGAAQPGLNVGNLVELQVMHPPLSLQVEFAKKFKEIENQKRAIEDSLKLLEDNYNSLMQRAFKGQLF